MKSRQAALVKDLAKLLTKYSARDWLPFVELLTSNPALLIGAVSEAKISPKRSAGKGPSRKRSVVSKAATKSRAKAPTKASGKKLSVKSKPKILRTPAKTPSSSAEDHQYRRVLTRASLGDLQTLYQRAFDDKRVPKSRGELSAALDKHLRQLSEYERTRLLVSVPSSEGDPTSTYRRWVDIIAKGPPRKG